MVLHDLRQIAYPQIRRHLYLSGRRFLKAADKFQYGRLTCTVLPYQADLVILADMETDVVEQSESAVCYSQRVYGNHNVAAMIPASFSGHLTGCLVTESMKPRMTFPVHRSVPS